MVEPPNETVALIVSKLVDRQTSIHYDPKAGVDVKVYIDPMAPDAEDCVKTSIAIAGKYKPEFDKLNKK